MGFNSGFKGLIFMLTPVEDVGLFTTDNTQSSPWTLLFGNSNCSFYSKQISPRSTSY